MPIYPPVMAGEKAMTISSIKATGHMDGHHSFTVVLWTGHMTCYFIHFQMQGNWSPRWSPHYILCLFWWLPGWSLCLCITWGDLVHTTEVSHHVYALFLACPITLDGSSGGQTGTGKVSLLSLYIYIYIYIYVFCEKIKLIMHCKLVCPCCLSAFGGS